jgi:hypothetical protein
VRLSLGKLAPIKATLKPVLVPKLKTPITGEELNFMYEVKIRRKR